MRAGRRFERLWGDEPEFLGRDSLMSKQSRSILQQRRSQSRRLTSKTSLPWQRSENLPSGSLSVASIPVVQRQALADDISEMRGNGHFQRLVSLQRSGDPAQEGAIASLQAKEQLLEYIVPQLQGKQPAEKENVGLEAITATAKAALETKTGKQVQKKVKRFLLSKEGVPLSIMLGTTAVAAMIANAAKVPSIPIPLSDNMQLTLDIQGPLNHPEGVMATFELKF
jgi:hypothetical protein